MPQIYVIIGPRAKDAFIKDAFAEEMFLSVLSKQLTKAVEKVFGIAGLNDVAFTAISSLYTKGEADVQIEIRYTAGTDEYNRGEPFNPSEDEQKELQRQIKLAFDTVLGVYGPLQLSLSVWCKPYYKSVFKTWEEQIP